MRIPVYEKQKTLQVPSVARGDSFRPSPQLFAENKHTRLAEDINTGLNIFNMLPDAADKLKQAREEIVSFFSGISEMRIGPSAGAAEGRTDPPAGASRGKEGARGANAPASAESVFAFAVQEARNAAQRQAQTEEAKRSERLVESVASLARTPEELQSVLAEGLAALPEERRPAVRARAVEANVGAALSEGETPEAAAMLARFESGLEENARLGARRRLAARAGERAAGEIYARALAAGETPAAWTEKDVKCRAARESASLPPAVRKEAREALAARAGAARVRVQRVRAGLLSGLLSAAEQGNEKSLNHALFDLARQNPSADETLTRAARRAASGLREDSDPARFNRLYRGLDAAGFDARKLEEAFSSGGISARDYLLLEREYASACGGEDVRARRLVCAAAERLCRKENLPAAEAEAFKYALFSLPDNSAGKLDALKKMREYYFL